MNRALGTSDECARVRTAQRTFPSYLLADDADCAPA